MSHLRDIYYELERHLFKKIDEFQYEFCPFDQQDAQYWLNMYIIWLSYTRLNVIGHIKNNKKYYESVTGGRIPHKHLENEIKIATEKVRAIHHWYQKQDLIPPELDAIDHFSEEWDAMLEGYEIRAKKWYDAKLEKIKSKFSQIEKSSEPKENWPWAIYALADELREMKTEGKVDTYKAAYEYGEKYWTVKGKPVTAKQLEKNYLKARSIGKL